MTILQTTAEQARVYPPVKRVLLSLSLPRMPVLLSLPALLLVIAVMAYPVLQVIALSFGDGNLQNYSWFLNSDANVGVLLRTFKISLIVTLVCIIVGYPYAFALTVAGPRLRLAMILCVLVPFWISGVVRTLAWVIILQDSGIINQALVWLGLEKVELIRTQLGVSIGMAQVLLPFMIMPLYSVMRSIDLSLVTAAKSLGSHPVKAFWQVYLPLSVPGILSGATIVFILALGFYITPLLLGGPSSTMLSTVIQQQVLALLHWGRGGAMGVILLISTFLCLAAVSPLMKRKYDISGGSK